MTAPYASSTLQAASRMFHVLEKQHIQNEKVIEKQKKQQAMLAKKIQIIRDRALRACARMFHQAERANKQKQYQKQKLQIQKKRMEALIYKQYMHYTSIMNQWWIHSNLPVECTCTGSTEVSRSSRLSVEMTEEELRSVSIRMDDIYPRSLSLSLESNSCFQTPNHSPVKQSPLAKEPRYCLRNRNV